MFVSIIIPTFNRAAVLPRALESAACQTYPEIEIIVVDDGSNDETATVVATYARTCGRQLKYIARQHGGCAAARNTGLAVAAGDCVLFLDSDDALVPTAVASLLEALYGAGADFVYSPAIEVYPDGTEVVNIPVAAGDPENFAVEHFFSTNVRNGAVLFRKAAVVAVGGVDETLAHNEDSDLLQRVALRFVAAYTDRPSVKVYHHADQKSAHRSAIYRALLRSTEKILHDSPTFAARLADRAQQRVLEIQTLLLESLVLENNFDDARAVVRLLKGRPRCDLLLALMLKTKLPVRLWLKLQRMRDRSALQIPNRGIF
ncbi:MAG: glycosyltransferase family 2 protein [Desulfobacterota bacterium]|nr:glycosyltransferase family 2 protein [Thermodesulfobacteriota bacterium]